MKEYHFCAVKHDPPHSYGDCVRACVASVLGIKQVALVPHFFYDNPDGEIGYNRLREYLLTQGLLPFINNMDGDVSLADIFQFMSHSNRDVIYMLFGSTASENDHVVVCQNDKIIHDPAWVRSKMVGPCSNGHWSILVFVPICE